MLNLLGCNKENFMKLLKKMNYKIIEKNNKIYFKYIQIRNINKKNKTNLKLNDSPFQKLMHLNIK